ncbi:uncharacterized protein LOC133744789 [Rosa rugosa]|uniref:uncharacterized protein LOC133744789 n=1 Tax=Rosa rugosa TaxID=74645 RepID=UPI002B407B41|nr:uncharacterized protein LOC133744789 [Rosa rugosa]
MSQILSWNCRGLGRALTVQKLGELIRSHSPSVVFLCETKQSCFKVNNLRRHLKFNKGITFKPSRNSSGGLALWWRPEVKVEVISTGKHLIDTMINFSNLNASIRFTFFYGPPYLEDKAQFWSSLDHIFSSHEGPWICVGDFNELVSNDEKEGGIPWHWNRIRYLKNFMDRHGLFDLSFTGPKFTWENCKEEAEEIIRERLDRAIGNADWLCSWPDSFVHHEPRVGSDHCPLVIYTYPRLPKGPKPFRFEASWAEDPECEEIVTGSWKSDRNSDPIVLWDSNLSSCRKNMIKWSRKKYPNNKSVIEALNRELSAIQNGPILSDSGGRVNEIIRDLGEAWKLEESFWKQRSRVNWLLNSDRNTKFFHLTTIQRRQRNRISRLCLGNDVWISGTLKAPGPDGFLGLFYTQYWATVHENINNVVSCFYNGEASVTNLNRTNIVLIPNVPHLESLNQFRPISLCNNSVKILAKLLANIMKPILPQIISEHQNVFVPGRQIQDNLILAHEAYHYLKLKKSKSDHELALKLDMNKAYDRVEWDFLKAALLKFGWVNLIMELGNSKIEALAYIRERIKQKLDGWKANVLSQAGRETLIKAVAMAVPAYPMSIFLMPVTLCKAINSDIANFWWGFSDAHKKSTGGLGIISARAKLREERSSGLMFPALFALAEELYENARPQFEELHTQQSTVRKEKIHFLEDPESARVPFIALKESDWLEFHNLIGSHNSKAWRDVIADNALWQVKNGKSIDVWKDRWVPNQNGGLIIPTDTSNRFTPLLVSEVIDEERKWNISHLEPFLEQGDIVAIKAIPIGDAHEDDRLVWPHNKGGAYSAKSGYKKLISKPKEPPSCK